MIIKKKNTKRILAKKMISLFLSLCSLDVVAFQKIEVLKDLKTVIANLTAIICNHIFAQKWKILIISHYCHS